MEIRKILLQSKLIILIYGHDVHSQTHGGLVCGLL